MANTVIDSRYILKNVSRSFALVIPMLGDDLVREVENQYLLARLVDTIEDSAHTNEDKKEMMSKFLDMLEAETQVGMPELLSELRRKTINEHDKLLIDNFDMVYDVFLSFDDNTKKISLYWLREMGEGMLLWAQKPIKTFADLDEYCYYVASTVGLYLTEIFEKRTSHSLSYEYAKSNGRFLQKVNIIRDFRWDYTEDRAFWPEDLFQGVSIEDVATGKADKNVRLDILNKMIKNAYEDRKDTFKYLASIPKGEKKYRTFCMIPVLMADATLSRLYNNDEVLTGDKPVKINRWTVRKIVLKTKLGFYGNGFLKKESARDL